MSVLGKVTLPYSTDTVKEEIKPRADFFGSAQSRGGGPSDHVQVPGRRINFHKRMTTLPHGWQVPTVCVFVRHMGLYLIGNPRATLQVSGKEYSLELTATPCPSKTQLRQRRRTEDGLTGVEAVRPSRNTDSGRKIKPGQRRAVQHAMSLWSPGFLS